MSDDTKAEKSNWKNNQSGVILVFSPIIFISLIFLAIDYFYFQTEFSDHIDYFSNLYINRMVVFSVVLIFWKMLKSLMSGYLLLVIMYSFNMLLVISDNVNINDIKHENINSQSTSNFFQLLRLKELFNYGFLIGWIIVLSINLITWYTIFMTRDTVIEEFEQRDVKTE